MQIVIAVKKKKNVINLSSAEFVNREEHVKVKENSVLTS